MNESNRRTIQSYEAHVHEYINGTPKDVSGIVKEWLDEAVVGLAQDARILEFGSAFGRDATYLQNLGDKVGTNATWLQMIAHKGDKHEQ